MSETRTPWRYDPALIPPDEVSRGEIGGGDFRKVGEDFLALFKEVGGLKPTDAVLDAGCGSGRMAAPLTAYLEPGKGRYEGFDITPATVAWCQQAYAGFRGFRFQLARIKSGFYGVEDGVPADEFIFPYADCEFDFVLLTSVFSHLPQKVLVHYIEEIARVLRPGGTCFATWYLVNLTSLKESRFSQTGIKLVPVEPYKPVWVADRDNPDAVTGYEDDFAFEVYRNHGLDIDAVHRGWWPVGYRAREAKTMQDIVVARKRQRPT